MEYNEIVNAIENYSDKHTVTDEQLVQIITLLVCPVNCQGFVGENDWHINCIDKAKAALKAIKEEGAIQEIMECL